MRFHLRLPITGMHLEQSGPVRQENMYMLKSPAAIIFLKGRKMIEASRKYNVRVQVGFQNRSAPNIMEAMKFLHDGGIGDVYMARGTVL